MTVSIENSEWALFQECNRKAQGGRDKDNEERRQEIQGFKAPNGKSPELSRKMAESHEIQCRLAPLCNLSSPSHTVPIAKVGDPMRRSSHAWTKPDVISEWKLGWETGLEPATFGATDRRSTS